jgi:hypothetical protein
MRTVQIISAKFHRLTGMASTRTLISCTVNECILLVPPVLCCSSHESIGTSVCLERGRSREVKDGHSV